MDPAHYTDPLEEALSHGSQRVAQLASLAAAMAQVVIQRRALEQARKAVLGDQRATRVVDDQNRLLHRQARLSWASAHDPQWLAQAGFTETARAWAGAAAYADTEPSAAAAMRKCENKLRDLHPYAMARYDRLRDDGLAPLDAMREAAPLFARAPDARVGDPPPARYSLRVYAAPEPGSVADEVPAGQPQPDPRADSRDAAEARGQQIIERIQAGALTANRPTLEADELAMVLEAVTNLPEEVIGKLTQPAVAGTHRHGGPSPIQVAAKSFPSTVADAVKAAATRGTKGATRAPAQVATRDMPERRGPAL